MYKSSMALSQVLESSTKNSYNIAQIDQCVIPHMLRWQRQGKRCALVTLIAIDGKAPYPVGTQMAVCENGQYEGYISSGCAERAIVEQAISCIKKKHVICVRYGRGSPYFDIQLPCGSGIDVLIHPDITIAQLADILHTREKRETIYLHLHRQISSSHTTTQNHYDDAYFTCRYQPRPKIIVAGQGPIVRHVTELAGNAGFDTEIYCDDIKIQTELHHQGMSVNKLQALNIDTFKTDIFSCVVSLFHEHDYEQPLLNKIMHLSNNDMPFYIGALGSKQTHQQRLEKLALQNISADKLARIHGPIGINIRAQQAQHIAISILADLVKHLPE